MIMHDKKWLPHNMPQTHIHIVRDFENSSPSLVWTSPSTEFPVLTVAAYQEISRCARPTRYDHYYRGKKRGEHIEHRPPPAGTRVASLIDVYFLLARNARYIQ